MSTLTPLPTIAVQNQAAPPLAPDPKAQRYFRDRKTPPALIPAPSPETRPPVAPQPFARGWQAVRKRIRPLLIIIGLAALLIASWPRLHVPYLFKAPPKISNTYDNVNEEGQVVPEPPIINLSAEDMALIAQDQPPQLRSSLAADASARKDFANDLRKVLAVAEEARAKGIGNQPEVKAQLDLVRSLFVAEKYFKSQGGRARYISDQEIEEFFKQPGNQAKFDQFINDAKVEHPQLAGGEIPQVKVKQIKRQFGQVLIGESRAMAAGFDKQYAVELQIKLEEARILAKTYAQEHLADQMYATDQEIDAYIAQHTELNIKEHGSSNRNKSSVELQSSREKAREAVEIENQKKVIQRIVDMYRTRIIIAEDYSVSPPSQSETQNSKE